LKQVEIDGAGDEDFTRRSDNRYLTPPLFESAA
jgi:hypothetical protein